MNRLFFIGVFAALSLVVAFGQNVTVHLAGDSTMADKQENAFPETGWGSGLRELLKGSAIVQNHAMNGRSSKSFIEEGRWDKLKTSLKPGDVVIIQFGHNDQKKDRPAAYAEAWSDYQENLRRFVRETRALGAQAILVTSICRRLFDEDGRVKQSLGDYPEALRGVAKEMEVTLVDLNRLSEALLNALGVEGSRDLFLQLAANQHPNYPDGVTDNTHLSPFGAESIARLFVADLRGRKDRAPWIAAAPTLLRP